MAIGYGSTDFLGAEHGSSASGTFDDPETRGGSWLPAFAHVFPCRIALSGRGLARGALPAPVSRLGGRGLSLPQLPDPGLHGTAAGTRQLPGGADWVSVAGIHRLPDGRCVRTGAAIFSHAGGLCRPAFVCATCPAHPV